MTKKIKYFSMIFVVLGIAVLFFDVLGLSFYLVPFPAWVLAGFIDRFEITITLLIKMAVTISYFIIAAGIYKLKNWARIIAIILQAINTALLVLSVITGALWWSSAPDVNASQLICQDIIFTLPFIVLCIFCVYFLTRKNVREHFG